MKPLATITAIIAVTGAAWAGWELAAPGEAERPLFACSAPTHHDGDAIRCAGQKSMRLDAIPTFEKLKDGTYDAVLEKRSTGKKVGRIFLQQTGDLAALQRILGHRTITMTMRYSHLLTDHLHVAMRKFSDGVAGSVGTTVGTSATVSSTVSAQPSG